MSPTDIAIIGMSCYFPGSESPREFWSRIAAATICIDKLSSADGSRSFSAARLPGQRYFDPEFFGIPRIEAELLDPQHRLMLQVVWNALQDARALACLPREVVSVYLASAPSSYLPLLGELPSLTERYQALTSNLPDFIATRVSHRFDLRGESMTIGTGCSSSLVAVHMACQSIISGQSTVALAGGVTVVVDEALAHIAEEGMILAASGECRPFDAEASGTVPGSGVGVVVLKSLEQAVKDGDPIRAVIKSSALNNDGRDKAGFMAPSVSGQSEAITTALDLADIDVETIGYLETHGTGTRLGDPVEIDGLRKAFGRFTNKRRFCGLGALKANFGHLDRAAGIAGLIKSVLCLQHGSIPTLSNFQHLNPEIELDDSPFYIPRSLTPWRRGSSPRRAAVSSFGVGGTNAHVILEESPEGGLSSAGAGPMTFLISARSPGAAKRNGKGMMEWLERGWVSNVPDACKALAAQEAMEWRAAVTAVDTTDAIRQLSSLTPQKITQGVPSRCVFLFPGNGLRNYMGMASWYATLPSFRAHVDRCDTLFGRALRVPVQSIISDPRAEERTLPMSVSQVICFVVQSGVCEVLSDLGIEPSLVCGHSVGEISAAWRAGALALEDAARLVFERGRLMEALDNGRMLSVPLHWKDCESSVQGSISIAAYNTGRQTILSGLASDIRRLRETLLARGVESQELPISVAGHSRLLEPILDEFEAIAAQFTFHPLVLPLASNVSGHILDRGFLPTSKYWREHVRHPVQFYQSVIRLLSEGADTFIEVGPGHMLTRMVSEIADETNKRVSSIAMMPSRPLQGTLEQHLTEQLSAAWVQGLPVDTTKLFGRTSAAMELPPYAFEKQLCWVSREGPSKAAGSPVCKREPRHWLFSKEWVRASNLPSVTSLLQRAVWISGDEHADTESFALELSRLGAEVYHDPSQALAAASAFGLGLDVVRVSLRNDTRESAQQEFYNALTMYKRLSALGTPSSGRWWNVNRHRFNVLHSETVHPQLSANLGFERVLEQEHPEWRTFAFDAGDSKNAPTILGRLIATPPFQSEIAVRREHVYVSALERAAPSTKPIRLAPGGVYVITGGRGKVGTVLANAISRECPDSTIILMGRSGGTNTLELASAPNHYSISVDVSDLQQLRAALKQCRDRFGKLNGIVHCAADVRSDRFNYLQAIELEEIETTFRAKVDGARNLALLIEPDKVDFVILSSSLSTEIGGLRFGAYVAANGYLDALAEKQSGKGGKCRWMSVAWDAWNFPNDDDSNSTNRILRDLALLPEEGEETLLRLLCADGARVVVSTMDPEERKRHVRDMLHRNVPSSDKLYETEAGDARVFVRASAEAALGHPVSSLDLSLRELGFDSLTTMRLVVNIRHRLKVPLMISSVKGSTTLNEVISRCEELGRSPLASSAGSTIPSVPPKPQYLASNLQRRWFKMASKGYGYINVALKVEGRLDTTAFDRALRQVLEKHHALHTRFDWDGAELWQIPSTAPRLRFIDMSASCSNVSLESVLSQVVAAGRIPFDLEREVPLRVFLYRLSPQEHVFQLYVHHILMDGTSSTLFLRELDQAYAAVTAGIPPSNVPLLQYTDFSEWQRGMLKGPEGVELRAFWSKVFGEAPPILQLTPEGCPTGRESTAGDHVSFTLSARDCDKLRKACASTDVSLFDGFLALYALLLARITGKEDIIIGTTLAGRGKPGLDAVIGVFVTPMPIRLKLGKDKSLRALLKTAHEVMNGFHEHQMYPLEALVAETPAFQGLGLNDTFRTYILMQNYPSANFRLGDLSYQRLDVHDPMGAPIMRDLELVLIPDSGDPDHIHATFEYRREMFARAVVDRWAEDFRSLITSIDDEGEISQESLGLPSTETLILKSA